MTYEGVLPVNKPSGFTSHDVVAKVRRILREKRIGHTGTLDPAVTGVLPLCIGRATRIVEYVQELPKEYVATLKLGLATDTGDLTGTVVEELPHVEITPERTEQALLRFVGEIEQIPPMYSAVKVDGKRLYELARQGLEVSRKPRVVTIHRIGVERTAFDQPHPELTFRVSCSKGTYIRTLCADIGAALGVPAVMAQLVRTATGPITLDQCLTLDRIEQLAAEGELKQHLIRADLAVPHVPACTVGTREMEKARQGRRIDAGDFAGEPGGVVRLYGPGAVFIGFFRFDQGNGEFAPEKVFL